MTNKAPSRRMNARCSEEGAEDRLVEVAVPVLAHHQRQDGDGQQHDDERNDAPEREQLSQLRSGRGDGRQEMHWPKVGNSFRSRQKLPIAAVLRGLVQGAFLA
jgi:hypothetical protein